jgi:hypothetical protein
MTIFIFVLILIIIIEGFIIYMLARKPKMQYVPARDIAIQKNAEKEKEYEKTVEHINKLKNINVKDVADSTINNVLDGIKL